MEKNSIEKFGLEPVPEDQKTTRWYEFAIIQFSFSANAGNFLVPALAVLQGGLSMGWALLSTLIGAGMAYLMVSLMSYSGAQYGIPAQFAMRAMLGVKGARYVSSPARCMTSLYWFSVQIVGGTLMIQALSEQMWKVELPFLPVSLTLAFCMSILAVVGFDAVKNITRYGLPLLTLGSVTFLYVFITSPAENFMFTNVWNSQSATNTWTAKVFFAGLAFIQYIPGSASSADLARYAKSAKEAHWGLLLGNALGFLVTAIIATYAAAASGDWNPYVAVYQATSSIPALLIIFSSGMLAMVIINMFNAYSGGFSLLNSFPGLGRIRSTLYFCIVATVLGCFPTIVEEAKEYISVLGYLIAPVIGVVGADFLVIKKRKIDLSVLTGSYTYNQRGITMIFIGTFLAFVLPASWIPGVIAFFVSGVGYCVWTIAVSRPKPSVIEG
ncbi:purine-cytosine permease family protein [Ammoniphilus resinae]|uniref:Cytosine permease n=1 Tax=Ammoniphilus resinae TaxID=861532 RepID=A0ABS4GUW2_9BACL|nr:cytosine permease [Ammoniphilus resinae]MBP1934070.1 cytosine permease [Ammoniphilus resinae]